MHIRPGFERNTWEKLARLLVLVALNDYEKWRIVCTFPLKLHSLARCLDPSKDAHQEHSSEATDERLNRSRPPVRSKGTLHPQEPKIQKN
jgi:hypothetical protein